MTSIIDTFVTALPHAGPLTCTGVSVWHVAGFLPSGWMVPPGISRSRIYDSPKKGYHSHEYQPKVQGRGAADGPPSVSQGMQHTVILHEQPTSFHEDLTGKRKYGSAPGWWEHFLVRVSPQLAGRALRSQQFYPARVSKPWS